MRANPFRTLSAVAVLALFFATGASLGLVSDERRRRTLRLRANRRWARLLARAIRLDVRAVARAPETDSFGGRLVLANHVSILDVVALAALEDAVFVTSREMGETFGIGALARAGGAAFVERRNRDDRARELAGLEELLAENRTIVLFPEGTSTDDTELLRFRHGLLPAALHVPGARIAPIALRYRSIAGRNVAPVDRERLFLYGDISVVRHLVRIFTNPPVAVEAVYLAEFAAEACADAFTIARRAETEVRSARQA